MNPAPFLTLGMMAAAAVLAVLGNRAYEFLARKPWRRRVPKCGRVVCAWCKPQRDIGPAPLMPEGEITHGICQECRQREFGIAA